MDGASATFRARRRLGARGRLGMVRAVTEDDCGRVLLVRSPADAERVAAILNADFEDDGLESSPPVPRYSAVAGRRDETLVVAGDRGRDRGLLRPGIVAGTMSRELAEELARRLNGLDPAVFKPPSKGVGIGWF